LFVDAKNNRWLQKIFYIWAAYNETAQM